MIRRNRAIFGFCATVFLFALTFIANEFSTNRISADNLSVNIQTSGNIETVISAVSNGQILKDGSVTLTSIDQTDKQTKIIDQSTKSVKFQVKEGYYNIKYESQSCSGENQNVLINQNRSSHQIAATCSTDNPQEPPETEPIKDKKGVISGMITDSLGNSSPVQGARITFNGRLEAISTADYAFTNYRISGFDITDGELKVEKRGYKTQVKQIKASSFKTCDDKYCYTNSNVILEHEEDAEQETGDNVITISAKSFDIFLHLVDENNNNVPYFMGITARASSAENEKNSSLSVPTNSLYKNSKDLQVSSSTYNLAISNFNFNTNDSYEIRFFDASGRNTFELENLNIKFSSSDIKKTTDADKEKLYFYKKVVLKRKPIVDIQGYLRLDDTKEKINGEQLGLFCDGQEVATSKTDNYLNTTNSSGANYIFSGIEKSKLEGKNCEIKIIGPRELLSDNKISLNDASSDRVSLRSVIIKDLFAQTNQVKIIKNINGNVLFKYRSHFDRDGNISKYSTKTAPFSNYKLTAHLVENGNERLIFEKDLDTGRFNISDIALKSSDFELKIKVSSSHFAQKEVSVKSSEFELNDNQFTSPFINITIDNIINPATYNFCLNELKDSRGNALQASSYYIFNKDIESFDNSDRFYDAYLDNLVDSGSIADGAIRISMIDFAELSDSDVWSVFISSDHETPNLKRAIRLTKAQIEALLSRLACTDVNQLSSYNPSAINYENGNWETTFSLNFFDASSNTPINIENELESFAMLCSMSDNTQSYIDESGFEKKGNRLDIRAPIKRSSCGPKSFHLNFKNYVFVEQLVEIEDKYINPGPWKVFLISKSNPEKALKCQEFNGVKFCSYYYYADTYFEKKENLEKISSVIHDISSATKTLAPAVLIGPPEFQRAFAQKKQAQGLEQLGPNWIFLTKKDIETADIETTVHETLHVVDFYSNISTEKINTDYFNTNLDTAIEIMKMFRCHEKDGFGDTKYFSFCYPARTNEITDQAEMWAVFASWWYLKNDDFKLAISEEGPLKDDDACVLLLKFMQAMIQIKFPDLIPIKQGEQPTSKIPSFFKKAYLAKSDSSNPKTLSDFGIYRDKMEQIDVVENFGLIRFTKDEISKGLFLKKNYENAPLNEKAAIRFKIGAGAIYNGISKNFQKSLDAYNTWYDSILKKLGKFKNTASVDIKVIDQNDFKVSDAVVMLGNKTLTTDSSGHARSDLVPAGEYKISAVYDGKNKLKQFQNPYFYNGESVRLKSSRLTKKYIRVYIEQISLKTKLVDDKNQPIAQARILFQYNNRKLWVTTDDNGIAFGDLPSEISINTKIYTPYKSGKKTKYKQVNAKVDPFSLKRSQDGLSHNKLIKLK